MARRLDVGRINGARGTQTGSAHGLFGAGRGTLEGIGSTDRLSARGVRRWLVGAGVRGVRPGQRMRRQLQGGLRQLL